MALLYTYTYPPSQIDFWAFLCLNEKGTDEKATKGAKGVNAFESFVPFVPLYILSKICRIK